MVNAVDEEPMLLCSDVSPRTSTEPVIEPLVYVKKLEIERSQQTTRAMLIFEDLDIWPLEGKWKTEHIK